MGGSGTDDDQENSEAGTAEGDVQPWAEEDESRKKAGMRPWFARSRGATLLLFRVNRRPLPQLNMFTEQPEGLLDHIVEVLLFGEVVLTGGAHAKRWVLGNSRISLTENTLSGQIGYDSDHEEVDDRYDEESQSWEDATELVRETARAPFVFDANTRILAVLKHPSFSEETLPDVFKLLLNRGEQHREIPTTDWDVEPVLDTAEFFEWLAEADSVEGVTFTAKMPNPSGNPEFEPVWSRLEGRKLRAIKEIMEAADPVEGIVGLEEDEVAQAYIKMASNGFGFVKGKGVRNGVSETYDQRKKVKRHHLRDLPETWQAIQVHLVDFVKRQMPKPWGDR